MAPAADIGRHLGDAGPDPGAQQPVGRDALGSENRDPPRVVAPEHEAMALVIVDLVAPELPELAVVPDPGRDVELGIVDRVPAGVPGLDLLEGARHQLHQAAGADPALRS